MEGIELRHIFAVSTSSWWSKRDLITIMISSSKEADHTPKQEDKSSELGKISKASPSSTSWSRLKDPRIVRVSRAFGGKDRHSKVCTVRGLRDRRVRLSVPTAIQLYDLQDRLGLNQPSKVVDWLLNVAKNDIDELPPLQVPPGSFSQFHQAMLTAASSHGVNASQPPAEMSQVNWNDHLELSTSKYWSNNSDGNLRDRMKSKEIVEETECNNKQSWTKRKQDGDLDQGHNGAFTSTNFFQRANSAAGMLNNMNIPIQNPSFLRWDPSNISRSHTTEDPVSQSTSLSTPSGSHQFVVYPHARELDPKQMFNFQMLSSSITSQNSPFSNPPFTPPLYSINQAMRPFHLGRDPYSGNAPNKDE